MSTATVPRYTAAEYLAFERASDEKHEFFNGELFAMAGGTRNHSRIAANLIRAFGNVLADGPCSVNTGDLRIACPTGLYTYPDLSIDCGRPQMLDAVRDTLLNPVVIVEILSPSTERYDRTTKFDHYRTIPSLREYVLVSQDAPRVEHFARDDGTGGWRLTTVTDLGETVQFPALACGLAMADVYLKVEFAPDSPPPGEGNGIVVRPPQT
jgi:Uma2 family endonuclease